MNPREKLLLSRILAGSIILGAAIGLSAALIRFSRQPAQIAPPESRLAVRVMNVQPGSATTTLSAHGVVRPLREAHLSAEVSGVLRNASRTVRTGEFVAADDVLARIDPRDYEIALADAKAGLKQAQTQIDRLDVQEKSDRERHTLTLRAKTLAETEYLRTKRLFEEQEIGSISFVEASEQAFTQAATQLSLLDQSLALYPALRAETDARIAAAEARVRRAEVQLDRTEVRAPFAGRITHAAAETGENVQPGQVLFHLADDQLLEVIVPLEASDVRNWLRFEETQIQSAWFPPLQSVPVTLTWAEAARKLTWTGTLHRIVNFDSTTRTVTVSVRIDAAAARSPEHPLPLAAGMFCRVDIPGRTLDNVYTLPRAAVTFDANVYLADSENRLRTVSVEVLRAQKEDVLVQGGLTPGDRVITTRLISPLEGALLDIQEDGQEDGLEDGLEDGQED